MSTTTRSSLAREVGVFTDSNLDELEPFFEEHGFAILRGLYTCLLYTSPSPRD